MNRSRQEPADFQCPACGSAFEAPVWIIVDAVERPDLIAALNGGDLRRAACPQCGAAGTISAPLLYHDALAERLLLAVPPSVASQAEAQALAEQLVGFLHAAIDDPSAPYLGSVELVADLDGLREALAGDPDGTAALVAAVEALLAAGSAEFEGVLARHRSVLMGDQAADLLDALEAEAGANGDAAGARHIASQRAILARMRAALDERRALLDELLHAMPADDDEASALPALHAMIHAVDPQEVYAARLRLPPADQALLDRLLDRLTAQAETAGQESALDFLHALQALRDL